jgi:hypothetical protein
MTAAPLVNSGTGRGCWRRRSRMECFRIDESGYTGFDLLNRDQPFQGAAAVAIDDKDAALLIERHFPNLQATELKFSALVRRPGNHAALLALQRDLLSAHKCVTYVCEKRFLLILMFLDYATEPYWYRRGVDFYADRQGEDARGAASAGRGCEVHQLAGIA